MTDLPTPSDLVSLMIEAARSLEEAQSELVGASRTAAESERLYRQSRAQAWLTATEGTAEQKKDHVSAITADRAYRAHLDDALAKAALELVRSRRATLSAYQSISNAVRAEFDLARTGPEGY